jgi:hypothetical protein
MPYFDVKYWDFLNTPDVWAPGRATPGQVNTRYCLTPANTPEEAMIAFRGLNKNATPINAVKIDEWETRDREYWRKAWKEALAKMPAKIKHHVQERWEIQERGTTPLPEFIKEQAKGNMRLASDDFHEGNVLIKKIVTRTPCEYGRTAALAVILGYITTDGKDTKRPRANCCALNAKLREGSRPRNARTRKLLATIPKMTDEEIKKLLGQGRKRMRSSQ